MDEDEFDDLVSAAESSPDFWDNPYDDEGWNKEYVSHKIRVISATDARQRF